MPWINGVWYSDSGGGSATGGGRAGNVIFDRNGRPIQSQPMFVPDYQAPYVPPAAQQTYPNQTYPNQTYQYNLNLPDFMTQARSIYEGLPARYNFDPNQPMPIRGGGVPAGGLGQGVYGSEEDVYQQFLPMMNMPGTPPAPFDPSNYYGNYGASDVQIGGGPVNPISLQSGKSGGPITPVPYAGGGVPNPNEVSGASQGPSIYDTLAHMYKNWEYYKELEQGPTTPQEKIQRALNLQNRDKNVLMGDPNAPMGAYNSTTGTFDPRGSYPAGGAIGVNNTAAAVQQQIEQAAAAAGVPPQQVAAALAQSVGAAGPVDTMGPNANYAVNYSPAIQSALNAATTALRARGLLPPATAKGAGTGSKGGGGGR